MKQLFAILMMTATLMVSAQVKEKTPVATVTPVSSRATSEAKQLSSSNSKAIFEYTSFVGYVSKEGRIELKGNDYEGLKEDMVVNIKKRISESNDQSEQDLLMKQYEKMQNGELTVDGNLNLLGLLGYELVSTSTYKVDERTIIQFFMKRLVVGK